MPHFEIDVLSLPQCFQARKAANIRKTLSKAPRHRFLQLLEKHPRLVSLTKGFHNVASFPWTIWMPKPCLPSDWSHIEIQGTAIVDEHQWPIAGVHPRIPAAGDQLQIESTALNLGCSKLGELHMGQHVVKTFWVKGGILDPEK